MHLGDALPPCNTITLPPGFVGPVNCDPTLGMPNYPASQSQVANVSSDLQLAQQNIEDLQNSIMGMPSNPVSMTTLVLVAAGLVGLMMLSRR